MNECEREAASSAIRPIRLYDEFDSLADLENAVGSEARAEARRDFGQMPAFQGVVYHHAAVSEEVFSQ